MKWMLGFCLGAAMFGSSAHAEQANILTNPGFEEIGETGYPSGWFSNAGGQSGYRVEVDREERSEGEISVKLASVGAPNLPFGFVAQRIDARPFRGRELKLTASVKTGAPASRHVGLWFRIDKADGTVGFFENMQNRPIFNTEWSEYSITGVVAPNADKIVVGVLVSGSGKAWLDGVSLRDLGPASEAQIARSKAQSPRLTSMEGDTPPADLSSLGAQNLAAFARLYGLVRWFHPSDEAFAADWDVVAISAIPAIERARNPGELAQALRAVFEPLAPTLQIATEPFAQPKAPEIPPQNAVAWLHQGLGGSMRRYRSARIATGALDADDIWVEDLAGGVSIRLPLFAVSALDTNQLYAVAPDYSFGGKPPGWTPSGNDRTTRLAAVVTAWSLLSHFYPYWDVVEVDWDAELHLALTQAAKAADDKAFKDVLSRMVAATDDGHGVILYPDRADGLLPIDWAMLDDQLVVTAVAPGITSIQAGAIVTAINGVPANEVIAQEMALKSGSEQFTRYTGAYEACFGPSGETAQLRVKHATREQGASAVTVGVPYAKARFSEMDLRPEPVAELMEGIWYVDIGRVHQSSMDEAIDKLLAADGLIVDLRGYPQITTDWLRYLSDQTVRSPKFMRPDITKPDAQASYPVDGGWYVQPAGRTFPKARAFLTDGRAVSFSESIMGTVKANGLGVIVGSATAGANGGASLVALPGGYQLRYTGALVVNRDGSQHHLVGVLPDVEIMPTPEGLRAGRDEVLEKGLCIVLKAAGRQPCESKSK
ncbi:MAG: S41 family peptidase [Pseudomonadota bacterium]